MGYQPCRSQQTLGAQLVERILILPPTSINELLHLPQVNHMTINSNEDHKPLDLAAFRQSLAHKKGKEYWRSLSELAESEEFEEAGPAGVSPPGGLTGCPQPARLLKSTGRSLAMADLTACCASNQPKRSCPTLVRPKN